MGSVGYTRIVEILKESGLWTDEFRTRMDILKAIMDRDWENPILKENFTREQLEEMAGPPKVQTGGVSLAEMQAKVAAKTQALAQSQTARDAVGKAKYYAQNAFSKGKSLKDTLSSKLSTINPKRDLAKQLDPDSADGFLTMLVKWTIRMMSEAMASPSWPVIAKTLFAFVFVLSYAEGLPVFGGIIKASLEIVAFILPTIGNLIVSLGTVIGGPPGHILGLIVAAVFFILASMIAFSRQQFTEALVISANLIPFVGGMISNFIQKADNSMNKMNAARKQVYNSFLDVLGLVFGQGKVRGGMRFSRRRRHTKKWRTKRRRTSVKR